MVACVGPCLSVQFLQANAYIGAVHMDGLSMRPAQSIALLLFLWNVSRLARSMSGRCFYGPVEKELEVMVKAEQATPEETANGGVGPAMAAERQNADDTDFSLSRLIQKATDRRQDLEEISEDEPAAKLPRVAALATREAVMEEWAVYKSSIVTIEEVEHDGGPLAWWGKSERLFPHLAKLARRYLAVQVSCAAPDRFFSMGALASTRQRNSLGDERAADIVFLHESMRHKLW